MAIAAKQSADKFFIRAKEQPLTQISIPCKNIILGFILRNIHVIGLVLYENITIVSEDAANEDNVNYIWKHSEYPFQVLKDKISHVIKGYRIMKYGEMANEGMEEVLR